MLNRTWGVSIAGVAQASNVGRPGMSMSMSMSMSTDMVPGLVASSDFNPERAGCSRSVQVCVVDADVDPESDEVDIVGWAIGHDRGRVISPLLVEGQVLGAIAHGLGNALYEEARAADGATPAA
jgi:aerobic carbon-monoxide dehydrogenase large subunit